MGATALLPASINAANAGNFSDLVNQELNHLHEPSPLDPAEFQPFLHGVASGDPLPASVVLWTRVTPDPTAVPGSGKGEDVSLVWEVASDFDFQHIVRSGEIIATAEHDHTVHVDPWGLSPATEYFYRFRINSGEFSGLNSPIGRTQTAPAPTAEPEKLTLAICSCANFESGYFSAYSDIAVRAANGEIDAVIHLGDYIYEYASGVYTGKQGVIRPHEPRWELVTLADYRTRYGRYRRDASLQAAHQALPWIVMWDDHEFANNASEDGAPGHGDWQGSWQDRKAAAQQAYLEWLPVRWEGHLYRTIGFGQLAELTMLDLRSYRSKQSFWSGANDDSRTIMGSVQTEWLMRKVKTPQAKWSLIGTSVMMSPISTVGVDSMVSKAINNMIGDGGEGVPYNLDQWDGYAADRKKLLNELAQRDQANTIFLAGDIHSEWSSLIKHEGKVVGAELVCTSVSAPNIDDAFPLAVAQKTASYLKSRNSHVTHCNLDAHGYSLLNVTKTSVSMQWMRVDDVHVAGSPIRPADAVTFNGAYLES